MSKDIKHVVVVDNKSNLVASITINFETKDLEIINSKECDVRIDGISAVYGKIRGGR